jgi:hypothetical protein
MEKILPFSILFLIGCSPVPLIQSSRIHSDIFLYESVGQSNNQFHMKRDSLPDNQKIPPMHQGCGIGFYDRVELSGYICPFLSVNFWDLCGKVLLFPVGNDKKLFRNINISGFVTTNGYWGFEFGLTAPMLNGGGGVIIGTSGLLFDRSVELVFSLSRNNSSLHEQAIEFVPPDIGYKRRTVDTQLGLLVHPFRREIRRDRLDLPATELGMGCTYSRLLSEKKYGSYAGAVDFKNFTFQLSATIGFHR